MTVLKRAMVLAAGFGVRLRPITDTTPKPLVKVLGRTLIDRTIDRLIEVGVETVIVNTHHLGDQVHDHLKKRDDVEILFSPEDPILETGGGIAKALKHFGDEPFFACNGDTLWLNGSQDALKRMLRHWREDQMDARSMLLTSVRSGYAFKDYSENRSGSHWGHHRCHNCREQRFGWRGDKWSDWTYCRCEQSDSSRGNRCYGRLCRDLRHGWKCH